MDGFFVPVTRYQRQRCGCIDPKHRDFWEALEKNPLSGISQRPIMVAEADAAFTAAERSAAAGVETIAETEMDDEDEEEPLEELVMATCSLNDSLRKQARADTGGGAAVEGAPAQKKTRVTAPERTPAQAMCHAVSLSSVPKKTAMLTFIASLPMCQDGTPAVEWFKENGKTDASAPELQTRLRAYFQRLKEHGV